MEYQEFIDYKSGSVSQRNVAVEDYSVLIIDYELPKAFSLNVCIFY
jgi:hypothetical protein